MDSPDSSPCFDYVQASQYLFDRINYEKVGQRSYSQKNFRLARMHKLLAGLGNPHRKYPIIHIAGTKGKGSVAWLIAEAFRHNGQRVGLYTSPHLLKLEERFCVDGQPCSPEELVECINRIHPVAEQIARDGDGQSTFFELTTAIGFLLYAERQVDLAVIEVGLGGRLDSTNVCTPVVSVITSISFDHQQQLGNTIPLIAGEKAGIIKPKIPVVSGVLNPEAIPVIAKKATECGSELRQAMTDFIGEQAMIAEADEQSSFTSLDSLQSMNYRVLDNKWKASKGRSALPLRMQGNHQVQNAATAIAAIDVFCHEQNCTIDDAAIQASLAQTQVGARMRTFPGQPPIILDAAHNVASIEALLKALETTYPRTGDASRDRVIVFAASSDKEYETLLRLMIPATDTLIVTQYLNNPRAVDSQTLFSLANTIRNEILSESLQQDMKLRTTMQVRPVAEIHRGKSPSEALQLAKRLSKPRGIICITGSFFLAGEVLPFLKK